jgi:hypothetical protein
MVSLCRAVKKLEAVGRGRLWSWDPKARMDGGSPKIIAAKIPLRTDSCITFV